MSSITTSAPNRPLDSAHPGIMQTLSNALIITRREVRDSLRDWRIMAPIFILTLVFPLLANVMTQIFTSFFENNVRVRERASQP
jgi:hypothetical protein